MPRNRWCKVATIVACLLASATSIPAADTWTANLTTMVTGDASHQGIPYPSSSSLRVSWEWNADTAVDSFVVLAADARSKVRTRAPGDSREVVITGLKAATPYTVTILACLDAGCESPVEGEGSVSIITPAEYWRITGTGSSYATATRLVSDGNIGSYAFRYGPWAGPDKDGRLQLYYTPLQREEKGVKIGQQRSAPSDDPFAAATSFDPVSGFGLLRACGELPMGPGAPPVPPECVNPQGLATGVALYQAVPLLPAAPDQPGKVRLYFEAIGRGGRTRIVSLDSQDGYTGRDFHRGAATRCDTVADYATGGGCEPALVIGVDIDGPENGNPNLLNARQFKIAWPTAVSTAWDQAPGAFMWFTTEWRDGRCSRFDFNAAFAVWNGSAWKVQYGPDGCPKVLAGVQAPMPVHIAANGGGAERYKLYFSRHARPGGPTDPRVSTKPFQVLYADPEVAGDPATTDFEDWEPLDLARDVHFLWPDGGELTEDEESRLDDFVVFAPGPDPSRLILYGDMSATGLNAIPFLGSAILINP